MMTRNLTVESYTLHFTISQLVNGQILTHHFHINLTISSMAISPSTSPLLRCRKAILWSANYPLLTVKSQLESQFLISMEQVLKQKKNSH